MFAMPLTSTSKGSFARDEEGSKHVNGVGYSNYEYGRDYGIVNTSTVFR